MVNNVSTFGCVIKAGGTDSGGVAIAVTVMTLAIATQGLIGEGEGFVDESLVLVEEGVGLMVEGTGIVIGWVTGAVGVRPVIGK